MVVYLGIYHHYTDENICSKLYWNRRISKKRPSSPLRHRRNCVEVVSIDCLATINHLVAHCSGGELSVAVEKRLLLLAFMKSCIQRHYLIIHWWSYMPRKASKKLAMRKLKSSWCLLTFFAYYHSAGKKESLESKRPHSQRLECAWNAHHSLRYLHRD